LVLVTASPCTDWREDLIKTIREMPETDTLQLQKMKSSQIEEILSEDFKLWGTSIDSSLTNVIKQVTEGV
jgi:hypothetical protein